MPETSDFVIRNLMTSATVFVDVGLPRWSLTTLSGAPSCAPSFAIVWTNEGPPAPYSQAMRMMTASGSSIWIICSPANFDAP